MVFKIYKNRIVDGNGGNKNKYGTIYELEKIDEKIVVIWKSMIMYQKIDHN